MYHFDSDDSSLVFDGIEKGIADSPFLGISDARNINITSVPGEGSVNFATQSVTNPSITGTVSSADAGTEIITFGSLPLLETGMAVSFSVSTIGGVSTGTPYWVQVLSSTTAKLYSDYLLNSVVNISGTGTGTFTTYQMAEPRYGCNDSNGNGYIIDTAGLVWSNAGSTTSSGYWLYLGNTTLTNANGNGIVSYDSSNSNHYLFIWRNGLIDYLANPAVATSWVYGWKPSDGTTGNVGTVLKTGSGTNNPHEALLAPDNEVYYCDANWVGRFYQLDPTVPFVPTNTATYVFDQTSLLPSWDRANCLTFLGNQILVGGKYNVIYPWDRFSSLPAFELLLPEYNVAKMITVNTNTFILVGNRGRVYSTNGTNVILYKKIPDHISGTVEPYFTWGGLASVKNQLYLSAKVVSNSGSNINQYGGVWAINLDNTALRLSNKLSYGTYAGYATVLIPNLTTNPAGTGLYIGWNSGNSTYGVDKTISTPYVAGEATIDFDLVPIGTFNKPQDFTTVEYKLTRPLVSGESVVIKTRLIFNTSDTGYTATLTDNTVGNYSSSAPINFKNAQWMQLQAVLTSTASSPSYVRLKEIRISGVTGTQPNQLSL